MGLDIDASADPVLGTDGPELVESGSSLDRRLVHACGLVDLVGSVVSIDSSKRFSAGRWVVGAEALNDVVLDQWVLGPAVDSEVAVSLGFPGTAVGDGPDR